MSILDEIKVRRLYCDGGMGSLLQAAGLAAGELPERWNLSHPEVITDVHRKYLAAGADIMTTNTFGANRLKYDGVKGNRGGSRCQCKKGSGGSRKRLCGTGSGPNRKASKTPWRSSF